MKTEEQPIPGVAHQPFIHEYRSDGQSFASQKPPSSPPCAASDAATALRQPRCAISVAAQLMQGNEICEGRDFFCAENLRVFFLFA
ncbi:hypothetical protein GMES_4369 [Paraglaciecola mesophila KMM 241]|uniref:Uncharacterized protein n=1 Tax=Paraglaciecola mesophila KMM 241 TaxID=1128912 RepID=K6ZTJ3_9ALTE|nr:hypothetical protein GMES_4369 [Paraglaciecola mesophila KMM 241]